MIEYLMTGPFGIISMTFKYLICMLTPLVTAFAFCQMFLERSGIILRLESHSGKLLSHMGLSADCLLPLMSGFGCTTAALSALSGLNSSRERYIAAFLLSAAVPCSAQTAVIIGIAFVLPPSLFIFYISSVAAVFVISGIFLNILLPADKIYHTPRTKNGAVHMPAMFPLLKVSVLYGISFLKDTLLPFAAGSAILSVLSYTGFLDYLCRICAPVTESFLQLPREAASLFIMSIVKRDFGAAGLLSVIEQSSFTYRQLTVSMLILSLFVPCFASLIILLKQEGFAKALSIWAGSLALSILVGKLASLLLIS
ncbi:MAG: nucleoside recognition domain-containing protein [Anaerovoracaceae bacterium]|nr:nucleoside recognition domain-containing protein [Anaerovoracaceae bacterium]